MIFETKIEIDNGSRAFIEEQFKGFKEFKAGQEPFPEVFFYDPHGKKITIKDFQGRFLLMNVWATWCPPCVKELPSLEDLAFHVTNENMPIAVIAVSIDRQKTTNEIAEFLVQHDIGPFALYHDKDKRLTRAYHFTGYPTTLLIDPDGNVVYEFQGDADWMNGFLLTFLNDVTKPLKEKLEQKKSP